MNIFLVFLIFGVIFLAYKKIKSKKPKNLKLNKFKNKLQSTQTNIERIFLREEEKTFSNPNINIYIGKDLRVNSCSYSITQPLSSQLPRTALIELLSM